MINSARRFIAAFVIVAAGSAAMAVGAGAQSSLDDQIFCEAPSGFVASESNASADGGWIKTFLRNGKPLRIQATEYETADEAVFASAGGAAGFAVDLDEVSLDEHPTEPGVILIEARWSGSRVLFATYVEGRTSFNLAYPAPAPDDPERFEMALMAQLAWSTGERVDFPPSLLQRVREDVGLADDPARAEEATSTTTSVADDSEMSNAVSDGYEDAYESGLRLGRLTMFVIIAASFLGILLWPFARSQRSESGEDMPPGNSPQDSLGKHE